MEAFVNGLFATARHGATFAMFLGAIPLSLRLALCALAVVALHRLARYLVQDPVKVVGLSVAGICVGHALARGLINAATTVSTTHYAPILHIVYNTLCALSVLLFTVRQISSFVGLVRENMPFGPVRRSGKEAKGREEPLQVVQPIINIGTAAGIRESLQAALREITRNDQPVSASAHLATASPPITPTEELWAEKLNDALTPIWEAIAQLVAQSETNTRLFQSRQSTPSTPHVTRNSSANCTTDYNPHYAAAQVSVQSLPGDEEFPPLEEGVPMIGVARRTIKQKPKSQAKPLPATPAIQEPAVQKLLKEMGVPTEAALTRLLKERELQRREASRQPEYLTAEESEFKTLDQLYRKWRLDRQSRPAEEKELRATDFEELGELTDDIKKMRRAEIKRLMADLKTQLWANKMHARGIQILRCSVCNKLHTGQHQCMPTRWTLPQTAATSTPKGIVATRTTQGIHVHATPYVDEKRAQDMHDKAERQLQDIRFRESLTWQPNKDTLMQEPISSTSPPHHEPSSSPSTPLAVQFAAHDPRRL